MGRGSWCLIRMIGFVRVKMVKSKKVIGEILREWDFWE